jgi:diacylglycerol kinase family enzyme
MVSLMNGRRMGGSFYMAPQSVPDDQLFDLCIVGAVSRLGVFGLMPKFFNGSQYTNPAVKHKRSKTVKITALNGSLPAHGDGETICTAGHQLTVNMSDIKINLIINPEL